MMIDNKKQTYPVKRNLDGCYFRVCRDGEWQSVCFTDLTEAEQTNILDARGEDWIISLLRHLADRIRLIGDELDIEME